MIRKSLEVLVLNIITKVEAGDMGLCLSWLVMPLLIYVGLRR